MARKDWTESRFRLTEDPTYKELREIQKWLADGDLDQLEFASQVVDSFPHGKDSCFKSHWIAHAVSSGCLKTVEWMIKEGVNLRTKENDGYPPLITCVENDGKDKYETLSALIQSGADVNEQGINGWTPLHMAAIRDDERSMHMLLAAGADRTITTKVDDDATAEEEARILGHLKSAEFIARFSS